MNLQTLDDQTALSIFSSIVRAQAEPAGPAIEWTPDLERALTQEFMLQPEPAKVTPGDLARQALLLLAEDPATRSAIETMAASAAQGAQPQKFDAGATVAIVAATLIVLQTHIRFERAATGKWKLTIEKKPTSDALLKGLVQKLVSLIGH
jgi:hypothetical protein